MSDKDRHSKTEVERRVSECFKLRYESTPSIKQEEQKADLVKQAPYTFVPR